MNAVEKAPLVGEGQASLRGGIGAGCCGCMTEDADYVQNVKTPIPQVFEVSVRQESQASPTSLGVECQLKVCQKPRRGAARGELFAGKNL